MRRAWRNPVDASRCRRRCCFALIIVALVITTPLSAQPTPPTPPTADYVPLLVHELQAELDAAAQQSDHAHQEAAAQAKRALRKLASELLALGDRNRSCGETLVLWGITLTRHRELLDDWIDEQTRTNLLCPNALEQLSGNIDDWLKDSADRGVSHAMRRVPELLKPLADAAGLGANPDVVWSWLEQHHFREAADANELMIKDLLRWPGDLDSRIKADDLPETLRQDLTEVMQFLRSGLAYADLRPFIKDYQRYVAILLTAADVIRRVSWLSPEEKEDLTCRVTAAAALFKDRATRRQAISRIEMLLPASRLIWLIDFLRDDAAVMVVLKPVVLRVLVIADPGKAGSPEATTIDRLIKLVTTLLEARDLKPSRSRIPGEYREAERAVAKSYRLAEAAVMDHLAALMLEDGWKADPAMASLLEAHQKRLADLKLVNEAPSMAGSVGRIDPKSGPDFAALVRKACDQLTRPATQAEGHAFLSRFRSEAIEFSNSRHEGFELMDRKFDDLRGGLEKELKALREEWRRLWAEAWSFNKPGNEVASLRMLNRLDDTIAIVNLIRNHPQAAGAFNGWAAWEMPPRLTDNKLEAVVAGCKLASATAVESGPTAISPLLDRMENDLPMLELSARLSAAVGNRFGTGDDAASVIRQIVEQPVAGAWDQSHRTALATLSRIAFETWHARQTGRAELAITLEREMNKQARALLATLPRYDPQHIRDLSDPRRYDPPR